MIQVVLKENNAANIKILYEIFFQFFQKTFNKKIMFICDNFSSILTKTNGAYEMGAFILSISMILVIFLWFLTIAFPISN